MSTNSSACPTSSAAARPSASTLLRLGAALFGAIASTHSLEAALATAYAPTTADAYVTGSTPTNDANLKVSGAATPKKAYLRFDVTWDNVNGGRPLTSTDLSKTYTARLRLQTNAAFASTADVVVYPTQNVWTEAGGPWAKYGAELARTTVNNVAANTPVFIDVSDYISGPGTYSFCVELSGSTSDLSFHSNSATDVNARPKLVIQSEDHTGTVADLKKYYERDVLKIISLGKEYIDRYKAHNPASGAADIDRIGYFDATKPPYNLTAGGSATANYYALQRCVNEAKDARVAVYIPKGTYQINRQIQLINDLVKQSSGNNAETYWETWTNWDFPCVVMGNNTTNPAERTVISVVTGGDYDGVINSGSPDFEYPKAAFYYWKRHETTDPRLNKSASHFNAACINLDFNMNNCADAIAVDMGGAQGCMIRDVNIYGTSFFSGLHALPSAGGITENVTVNGGQYGIYAAEILNDDTLLGDIAMCNTVVACRFVNQTKNAVYCSASQGFTMVGCEIYMKSGNPEAAIANPGPGTLRGNLSVVECRVERAAAGEFIEGKRSVYVRDTYVKNCNPLTNLSYANGLAGRPNNVLNNAANWLLIFEYYDGTQGQMSNMSGFDSNTLNVPSFLNRDRLNPVVRGGKGYDNLAASDTPPISATVPAVTTTSLLTTTIDANSVVARHAPPPTPNWNDTVNVENAADAGAALIRDGTMFNVPNGGSISAADATTLAASTTAMQNLLNTPNKAIFLPRGEYVVGDTLRVPNNATVFGINKAFTRIKAQPMVQNGVVPLVQVGNNNGAVGDRFATAMLADLTLFTRQDDDKWYLLLWTVGRNSVVKDCNFDRRNKGASWRWQANRLLTASLVNITTTAGGGRWYNLWNDSDAAQQQHLYTHFKISGTREPLKIYHLNSETDENTPNFIMDNAQNVEIFGTKWEGAPADRQHANPEYPNKYTNYPYTAPTEPFFEITNNCQNFKIYGLSGNAALPNKTDVALPSATTGAIVIDGASTTNYLIAHNNAYGSYQSDDGYMGSMDFTWIKDTAGGGNFYRNRWEQFVLYRVGQPQNMVTRASIAGDDGSVQGSTAFGSATQITNELRAGDFGRNASLIGIPVTSYVSFDTTAIPDYVTGARIKSISLRLKVKAKAGTVTNVIVDTCSGTFGGTGLENGDPDVTAGVNSAAITVSASSAVAGNWLTFTLTGADLNAHVNEGGRTQMRLRHAVNNDTVQDYITFYSSDDLSPANRPALEIVYENPL